MEPPPRKRRTINPEVREVIARVFHFLQDEYNFMKMNNYDHCDLSPLANIRKRTAEATGVGERSVTTILKEEKEIMVSKPLAIQYKFPDPRTAKRLKINKELVKENEDQKEDEDRIKCEKEDNFKVEEEVFGL